MSFRPNKIGHETAPSSRCPRLPPRRVSEPESLDCDGKPQAGNEVASACPHSESPTAMKGEPPGGPIRRTVVVSLLWQGSASLVGQLISWLATLVVIRVLSPSDYGLMAMAGLSI